MNHEYKMSVASHSITPAKAWFTVLFFTLVFIFPCHAAADEPEEFRAAVIVSRHIKPYIDSLNSFRDYLDEQLRVDLDIHIMDQHDLEHPAGLGRKLAGRDFDLIVSIGPEATSLAWSISGQSAVPTVYSMILNPELLAGENLEPDCGLSLVIPVEQQLRDISTALPENRRVGILYDPDNNHFFISQVLENAPLHGLSIFPLSVSSSREVPEVLRANWENVDALWLIPDQTVISQTLVEYIIKEALFQKKPVIGYNRFFYDTGAAVAFVFNFEQIGRQTASLAADRLSGLLCREVVPYYEVLINRKVVRRLGLEVLEVIP